MTPKQAQEARILLLLTQGQAAKLARMPSHVIAEFERSGSIPSAKQGGAARLVELREAYEAAGVEFISENGAGAGVRMWKAEGGS